MFEPENEKESPISKMSVSPTSNMSASPVSQPASPMQLSSKFSYSCIKDLHLLAEGGDEMWRKLKETSPTVCWIGPHTKRETCLSIMEACNGTNPFAKEVNAEDYGLEFPEASSLPESGTEPSRRNSNLG